MASLKSGRASKARGLRGMRRLLIASLITVVGLFWLNLSDIGFLVVTAVNGNDDLVRDLVLEEYVEELPVIEGAVRRRAVVSFMNCSFHETVIHENYDTYRDIFGWLGHDDVQERHLEEFVDEVVDDCGEPRRFMHAGHNSAQSDPEMLASGG